MSRPWGRRSSSIWPANAAQLERHIGALFISGVAQRRSAVSGAKSRGFPSMLRVVRRLSRIDHGPPVHARSAHLGRANGLPVRPCSTRAADEILSSIDVGRRIDMRLCLDLGSKKRPKRAQKRGRLSPLEREFGRVFVLRGNSVRSGSGINGSHPAPGARKLRRGVHPGTGIQLNTCGADLHLTRLP